MLQGAITPVMVTPMELDELLDREGLDPDELMTWAHRRAEQLLAELTGLTGHSGHSGHSDELIHLLEPAGQIELEDVPVRRVTVAQDMLPVPVGAAAGHVEAEADESITVPISLEDEPDAAELGTRGRRRVPSKPQPLSASELPPPPEHTRLADGEPEPMLETVDTGPIDLGSDEARAMIVANSSRFTLLDMEVHDPADVAETAALQAAEVTARAEEPEATSSDEPNAASEAEPQAGSEADASDEFEIDELEELDDEELELIDAEDSEDAGDDAEVAPPPPPRPPPSKPAQPAAAAPPPAKPVDNHVDMDDLIAGLADSE
jgi:hypothetical protein